MDEPQVFNDPIKIKVARGISRHVSEAVVTSWNTAIDGCIALARDAGHFMLAAEMAMLKTSTDRVNAEVLKELRPKGAGRMTPAWMSSPVPIPAEPDRINVYVCQKCGGLTVTIDVHQGVTPFMIRCRASGREGDCAGPAESSFYLKDRFPSEIPTPAWEWFKPTGSEYFKLSWAMKDHVDQGGLDLRKRQVPA